MSRPSSTKSTFKISGVWRQEGGRFAFFRRASTHRRGGRDGLVEKYAARAARASTRASRKDGYISKIVAILKFGNKLNRSGTSYYS